MESVLDGVVGSAGKRFRYLYDLVVERDLVLALVLLDMKFET